MRSQQNIIFVRRLSFCGLVHGVTCAVESFGHTKFVWPYDLVGHEERHESENSLCVGTVSSGNY